MSVISFTINAQDFTKINKKDIFDVSGSIGTQLSFSDYGSGRRIQSPWSYSISSGLNFKVIGMDIPLSFAYVNGDKNFTHPFVRFGLSPKYKNIRAHLGYRSMNLSPAIFSGKTFLGAGAEVSFGAFSLSGFYGVIEGDRIYTKEGYTSDYDRKAYGIKMGFRKSSYFFDIVAFKAKDNKDKEKFKLSGVKSDFHLEERSVPFSYRDYHRKSYPINNSVAFRRYLHRSRLSKYGSFYGDYAEGNTSEFQDRSSKKNIYPADNVALGANAGVTLFDKVTIRSLFSLTGYTSNVKGKVVEDLNMGIVSPFLETRANSRTGYLSSTFISVNLNHLDLSLNHKMVSSDYKTLGIENLSTNYTTSSLNASSNLLEGKLNLTGFYSIYANNFNKKQLYTSKRSTYGFTVNSNVNEHLNISANYNGLHSFQNDGTKKIEEKERLDMSTHSINISPNYSFDSKDLGHQVSFNFDYSKTINNNKKTTYVQNSKNMLLSLSYSLSWLPKDLSGGLNYSFTKNWLQSITDGGHSVGVFASKTFLKEKNLSVNVSLNYGATAYEQQLLEEGIVKSTISSQNSLTASGGIRYTLLKNHRFSSSYTWSSNSYDLDKSRNTFRAFVSYSYTLPTFSSIYKKKNQNNKKPKI